MRDKETRPVYTIRGSCPLFACICCHTKYGFEHQSWCEAFGLTEPGCGDCLYHSAQKIICRHPAKKERKEEPPYEKDQGPL